MPEPTASAPSARLTEGEFEVGGEEIPVTVDCFLRGVFWIAGIEYAQVRVPTDEIQHGSFRVFAVPRKLVRVPPLVAGKKV